MSDEEQDNPFEEELEAKEAAEEAAPPPPPPSLASQLLRPRTIIPLIIVVVLLVLVIRNSGIHAVDVLNALKKTNPIWFVAAIIIYFSSFLVRAFRWKMLLENIGFSKKHDVHLPSSWVLAEIISISWMANCIVPAKLGDLYRAYLLKQTAGVSGTRTVGTVLAERVLDLTVLMALFVPAAIISLTNFHGALSPDTISTLQKGLGFVLLVVIVAIIVLVLMKYNGALIRRFLPHRFQEFYDQFEHGTLQSFKRLPQLAGLTVVTWGCEAGRFIFVLASLGLYTKMGFTGGIFVALAESLLTTVPATGGGLGLVEFGMSAIMLNIFGVPKEIAVAAVFLDRIISYWMVILLGLVLYFAGKSKK